MENTHSGFVLQVPPLSSCIPPVRWADLSRTAAAAHQESFSEPDQAAAAQITQPAGLRLYIEKFSAEFEKVEELKQSVATKRSSVPEERGKGGFSLASRISSTSQNGFSLNRRV